jgi:hypothetical protein
VNLLGLRLGCRAGSSDEAGGLGIVGRHLGQARKGETEVGRLARPDPRLEAGS